jgi:hypothetical protein
MKLHLKNFTMRRYIQYMRRQSKHMQHVHAIAFAGAITALIAGFIMYTDYGFWHETYVAEDALVATQPPFEAESPSESLGSFWREARERFGSIGSAGATLLEGKETYTKTSE